MLQFCVEDLFAEVVQTFCGLMFHSKFDLKFHFKFDLEFELKLEVWFKMWNDRSRAVVEVHLRMHAGN